MKQWTRRLVAFSIAPALCAFVIPSVAVADPTEDPCGAGYDFQVGGVEYPAEGCWNNGCCDPSGDDDSVGGEYYSMNDPPSEVLAACSQLQDPDHARDCIGLLEDYVGEPLGSFSVTETGGGDAVCSISEAHVFEGDKGAVEPGSSNVVFDCQNTATDDSFSGTLWYC